MSAIVLETTAPTPGPEGRAARQASRRRTWLVTVSSLVLLIGGMGYTVANWEWPVGAAQGTRFNGHSKSGRQATTTRWPRQFRVATFNIHGGFGLDGKLDLQRTAAAIRSADFVGLNEVRGPGWGDPRNQAEQIGHELGLYWLFAPTETTWSGPHFGQGILSKFPVSTWKQVPFERLEGNGYRNYVECQFPLTESGNARQLTILVTHLDRKSDRLRQLDVIIQRFLEVDPPAILMGDLNSKRTEQRLIELARQPGVTDCFGQHAQGDLPQKRIDWIFTRGLKCLHSKLESTITSDHPIGWADLEFIDHRVSR